MSDEDGKLSSEGSGGDDKGGEEMDQEGIVQREPAAVSRRQRWSAAGRQHRKDWIPL